MCSNMQRQMEDSLCLNPEARDPQHLNMNSEGLH